MALCPWIYKVRWEEKSAKIEKMPESRGKGLKPPKVDYNLKFLGLYVFSGLSFSYLKLTHAKPLWAMTLKVPPSASLSLSERGS